MKTKQFTYAALAFSCSLVTFTVCIDHETEIAPQKNASVAITASISSEVVTKANTPYQPAEGEKKIYLYYKDGSNAKANEKGVYTYGSSWTAEMSGNSIFWDDLETVGGKYPFFAVSPKDLANAATGSVEQDQSGATNFANSDLLMAYTDATTKKGNVVLLFKHMLAKLTVKVKVGAITNFSSSAVTIQNAKKEYTVNYTTPAPTADIPAAVAVKAGTSLVFIPYSEADESYDDSGAKTIKVYSIILPAQDISSSGCNIKTDISVGTTNNVYTYAPSTPVTLKNGTHTTLTLTIKGTGVELENIEVTDWTTATANGDITIDTP